MTLRVGTRGSRLALAQAALATRSLGDVRLVVIRTRGDDSEEPLAQLGEGIFVRALEDALRRGEVDLVVHSLKDLPTEESSGLVIAAIPQREDARDVLISAGRSGLAGLAQGATVGTSSVRRTAFLRALRPDVRTVAIRGNVDTRLAKVERGEYGGAMLALAGLRRLGIAVSEAEILPLDLCLPAPGQGALALQCRADDPATIALLAQLDDPATRVAVEAERALLRLLGASCEIPLGGEVGDLDRVVDPLLPPDREYLADVLTFSVLRERGNVVQGFRQREGNLPLLEVGEEAGQISGVDGDDDVVSEVTSQRQQVAVLGLGPFDEHQQFRSGTFLALSAWWARGSARRHYWLAVISSAAAANSWADTIGVAPYRPAR